MPHLPGRRGGLARRQLRGHPHRRLPRRPAGHGAGHQHVAGISGSFIGLVLGGLLAPIDWRLVFLVSVPFGLFGTLWAYFKLRGARRSARRRAIDWPGNVTFALGLILVMVGITYGIQPYGGHTMGWTSPLVLIELGRRGRSCWSPSCSSRRAAPSPMFRLQLFKIRAFTAGSPRQLPGRAGRGGLMFMLIIWLQGIWLPQHGYSFARTPLWAGICMLPLTVGFLIAGPVSGLPLRPLRLPAVRHRRDARRRRLLRAPRAAADRTSPTRPSPCCSFLSGLAHGRSFASPNRAGVMNSLPPEHRGRGRGHEHHLPELGPGPLDRHLLHPDHRRACPPPSRRPRTTGSSAQGVPRPAAARVAHLPPVSTLFAAFLGYNPMAHLLSASVLSSLRPAQAATLLGRSFFPRLIAAPFAAGLHTAFDFAAGGCAVAASRRGPGVSATSIAPRRGRPGPRRRAAGPC